VSKNKGTTCCRLTQTHVPSTDDQNVYQCPLHATKLVGCTSSFTTHTHTDYFYHVVRKQKTAPHNLLYLTTSHNLATPLFYMHFTSQAHKY